MSQIFFVHTVYIKNFPPVNVKPDDEKRLILPSQGPIVYPMIFLCLHTVVVCQRLWMISANYVNLSLLVASTEISPNSRASENKHFSPFLHWDLSQMQINNVSITPILSFKSLSISKYCAKQYFRSSDGEPHFSFFVQCRPAPFYFFSSSKSFMKKRVFTNHTTKWLLEILS